MILRTKFHGPTNRRQSRIVATLGPVRVTVPYKHNLSETGNHAAAAKVARERYAAHNLYPDWVFAPWRGGWDDKTRSYVFVCEAPHSAITLHAIAEEPIDVE